MKTLKFIILTLAIASTSFNRPDSNLTDAERNYAAGLLQSTREDLLKKVAGLTPGQLNFKADPSQWSIAECVEHIAIAENNFTGFIQASMKEAADPSKRTDVKMTDDNILKMITDRTNKVKTSEMFQPSGKFGSFEATLNEFKTKRANSIKYVNTTSDDLRNHYNDFPFGKIDTYQTIVFMAGHTRRHTAQIEEIMQKPGFPKK